LKVTVPPMPRAKPGKVERSSCASSLSPPKQWKMPTRSWAIWAERVDEVAVGGAAVDDEGEVVADGPFRLLAEDVDLLAAACVVPIEVDAYLTDADEGRRGVADVVALQQGLHALQDVGGALGELGGVEAYHGVAERGVGAAECQQGGEGGFVDIGQ